MDNFCDEGRLENKGKNIRLREFKFLNNFLAEDILENKGKNKCLRIFSGEFSKKFLTKIYPLPYIS